MHNTIKAYVEKGYWRRVKPDESSAPDVGYLSCFPVIRMDKTTTKVRIVFDCSAITDRLSLNDVICTGPKLKKDLFDQLMCLFVSKGTLLLLHVTLKKCICK